MNNVKCLYYDKYLIIRPTIEDQIRNFNNLLTLKCNSIYKNTK